MAAEQKDHQQTIDAARRNWQAEVETAQTYRDLAERERDEKRKGILLRMAEAEERHAQRWEAKLKELGAEAPVCRDTIARRLNRWWNKIAGAEIAIRRMEATEERQEAEFHDQAERAFAGEQDVQEFLRKSALEEKAHARVLSTMAPPVNPRTALDKILKRERWHGRGGSWVADAIYGANDGLGAVFGIVSGVAGATNNQQHYILISGLAGMLASTLSMGAGAYLAAKSEAEVYEAEISRERAEVEENPEEEIEEMSLFYQLQGFTPKNRRKWRSVWRNNPSNSCRRWRKASSAYPSIGFRINGPLLCQPAFPRQSARLFRSFRSFSPAASMPLSLPSESVSSRTLPSAP